MKNNNTEEIISIIHQNTFFKEFSYSKNKFIPDAETSELEFADNVVWLDDIFFIIQIKDRNPADVKDENSENNWFINKVLKKGKEQIKDTIKYLDRYENISITNERNHKFNITKANRQNIQKIIIYTSSKLLSYKHGLQKTYKSKEIGHIHLFNSYDYSWVCAYLITPAEINEYLTFREKISNDYQNIVDMLPEQAILGQFLTGKINEQPNLEFRNILNKLDEDIQEFDVSYIIDEFHAKITYTHYKGWDKDDENPHYYILKELAKLKRQELKEFKIRFKLAWEKCKKEETNIPYRTAFARTSCGFIFIPIPLNQKVNLEIVAENFGIMHKYDLKLKKCIGVAFQKDNDCYNIIWSYLENDWVYNEELENILQHDSPLSSVKTYPLEGYKLKD